MSKPPRISHRTKLKAAAWISRLSADDRTPEDEAAFRAWVSSDPTHAAACEAVMTFWDATGGLPGDIPRRPVAHAGRLARRRMLLALGAFATAGGSLAVFQTAGATTYRTRTGEQRRVVLEDGSLAFLDTDTLLTVTFDHDSRTANLKMGRVNFHIGPGHPFVIRAAMQRVTAGQSDLDVCRADEAVSVLVVHGSATVASAQGGASRPVMLDEGQRLRASGMDIRLDRPDLKPLLAWRTGHAMFRHTRLAKAVAEMNRYSTMKIVIADSAIANLRLSGVYTVGDSAGFAQSAAKLLGIAAHHDGATIILAID